MRFHIVEINYGGKMLTMTLLKMFSMSEMLGIHYSSNSRKDIIDKYVKLIGKLDKEVGYTNRLPEETKDYHKSKGFITSVIQRLRENGYSYIKITGGFGKVNSKGVVIGREIVLIDIENKDIKEISTFKSIIRENKLNDIGI